MTLDERVEAELRESMTDLEVRLLSEGYVPEFTSVNGNSGWHRPTVPLAPPRSAVTTVAGLIVVCVAILGLVVLLRGWPV